MKHTCITRNGWAVVCVVPAILLASCSGPSPLHKAAMRGDVAGIKEFVAKGAPVNSKDADGNTPLHYAYYHGQKDAVDLLVAYGADLTIRNKDGETPLDMAKLGQAERLIDSGAELLDSQADWTDRAAGRKIYDQLRAMDTVIVSKGLVRKVLKPDRRLQVLFLAVKLGIQGSEDKLAHVLDAYGDKSMAEDYLNSGSSMLYEAGRKWANARGYDIATGDGSSRVGWGRF